MSKTWTSFMILVLVLVWVWQPHSLLPLAWAGMVYIYAGVSYFISNINTVKYVKLRALFWPLF